MWQPDDPNAAKYETSLANQQIQQQGHQQQQIPQENVLLNMRKSLLKNFGRGMPSQVGDTCAMQNSYLNEKFVKSIFDKNKKPIAENIKTNQDQQLLDKSLIKYKDSYDHPVGKIRHNLLYEPEGFSIFKKNKLTPHKRAHYGQHHHYSPKYLQYYISEAVFKYNNRAEKSSQVFSNLMSLVCTAL